MPRGYKNPPMPESKYKSERGLRLNGGVVLFEGHGEDNANAGRYRFGGRVRCDCGTEFTFDYWEDKTKLISRYCPAQCG